VSDIEAAARFYAGLLEDPGRRVWSNRHYFDCGGTIVACVEPAGDRDEAFRPNPEHIYFSVDDVDAARERAAGAGAVELSEVAVQSWGERSFYARDPFGNPICFVDSGTLFTGE
jgi:uncharacterized glyoxalase superfamily protein PhnB